MREKRMDASSRSFRAGKRALSRHDAQAAMRFFRAAADSCAPDRHEELALYLYWLAIPLLRLGRSELAVKSLASAQKLKPRGFPRKLYEHMVNDYGMVSTGCEEKDDFRAFFSIQLRRYLGSRPGGRFHTEVERDAVACIISDAWLGLRRSVTLADKPCSDKLSIFRSIDVAFPFGFSVRGRVLAVNFRAGTALDPEDRCPCGSGLPYRQCCGRTVSPLEAEYGSF